jgi:hypothetical protein
LKLIDSVIESDEPGLFSFIENGKCAGDPQSSANGFLPPCLLIYEHQIGVHFRRERDRLALPWIELPVNEAALRTQHFQPCWRVTGPVLDWFRRKGMLQFRQHSRRNKNSSV